MPRKISSKQKGLPSHKDFSDILRSSYVISHFKSLSDVSNKDALKPADEKSLLLLAMPRLDILRNERQNLSSTILVVLQSKILGNTARDNSAVSIREMPIVVAGQYCTSWVT